MTRLALIIATAALWWPAAAAAQKARLSMVRAKVAIARYDGGATVERCWQIRNRVTACDFSVPYEEGWTFHYYAVARLHRSGAISVEWPGWR